MLNDKGSFYGNVKPTCEFLLGNLVKSSRRTITRNNVVPPEVKGLVLEAQQFISMSKTSRGFGFQNQCQGII